MKPKKPVEVIVFEDPERRNKDKPPRPRLHGPKGGKVSKSGSDPTEAGPSQPILKFDQKATKHQIRKMGIHGMDKKGKEEAMRDLLIELGAKPTKKRCYHIQEYNRIQKEKKQEEEQMEELERQAGVKKKKQRVRRKRDKDDLLNNLDGQDGFYKNGVQYVKPFRK